MPSRILIFGADRPEGERMARTLAAEGIRPLLGGTDGAALTGLGRALDAGVRIFDHHDGRFAVAGLAGVAVVLNCAGHYPSTAAALVDACLRTGAHYVDLCAAWDVLESVAQFDVLARQRRVTLVPGIGLEGVAGDCLAAQLLGEMPGASHIELAVHIPGALPVGAVDVLRRRMGHAGALRSAGHIRTERVGSPHRRVDFGLGPQRCMALPLAPLATLDHSVGTPNVIVYASVGLRQQLALRLVRHAWWMGRHAVSLLLAAADARAVSVPPRCSVYGEARDGRGRSVSAILATPAPDAFTATAAAAVVRRLLAGGVPAGYHTASTAFGADFVLQLRGVVQGRLERSDGSRPADAQLEPARGLR